MLLISWFLIHFHDIQIVTKWNIFSHLIFFATLVHKSWSYIWFLQYLFTMYKEGQTNMREVLPNLWLVAYLLYVDLTFLRQSCHLGKAHFWFIFFNLICCCNHWNQPPPKSQQIVLNHLQVFFRVFPLQSHFYIWCFSHSQIQDFPSMLNFYHISVIQFFKSNWPEVRAGAAMFIGRVGMLPRENNDSTLFSGHALMDKEKTEVIIHFVFVFALSGFLLGNLPEEHLSHLNMGTITKGDTHIRLQCGQECRYLG